MGDQDTKREAPPADATAVTATRKRSPSPPATTAEQPALAPATTPAAAAAGAEPANKKARIDHRGNDAGPSTSTSTNATADDEDAEKRLPKRKVAVLFGYCGVGYSGLQVNPGVKTIEGDIFDVMCEAGCISKENAVNPNKVALQRAARTDRGVHAAGNLINLKLILNPPACPSGDEDELVKYLNSKLPPLIRIWAIKRVQSAFNARMSCDSRRYQYLLPTYVFLPPKPGTAMWNLYKRWHDELPEGGDDESKKDARERLQRVLEHPFWAGVEAADAKEQEDESASSSSETPFKRDTKKKRAWRMASDPDGPALLARVRKLFDAFTGVHNFHNYTVAKPFRDPSAKRVMKKLEISDPFIVNDTEYLSVTLHGQSFMLHQIRKMIGLLVLVARSPAPEKIMQESFGPTKIHVPKAPALGLLLNSPHFDMYNSKVVQQNNQMRNKLKANKVDQEEHDASVRPEISFEPYKNVMEEFRMKNIYQFQYETEEQDDEFAKWLNYLDSIVGPDFTFLNTNGVIPREAINAGPDKIKKGGKGGGGQPKKEQQQTGGAATAEAYQESDDEEEVSKGGKGADLEG